MDTRREFIKKASVLSGGATLLHVLPPAIQKALAIDPAPGSTYLDAEHIVLLMQENRSFDHTYGTLQGVRGFNDPRAIRLPDKNRVWLQSDRNGDCYAPFRLNIKDTKATWMNSLPHGWDNQVDARNRGKYDQWLNVKHSGNPEYAPMPLTLGYYTREDIPFYYALADAFTVCDQHFCASLTGTTPNRLYFWTGTIRAEQKAAAQANVWNEDADYNTEASWTTYPERLEDNGVSWKIYQNELSVGVGFDEEEDPWLANFGDNPIEYFTQYRVRMSAAYIAHLPKAAASLRAEIEKMEKEVAAIPAAKTEAHREQLGKLKEALARNAEEQKIYTRENYEKLSQRDKNLHEKAFSTNTGDPFYHELTTLNYEDDGTGRTVKIPRGDVLHQFRQDVEKGDLPTVSWIVAPEHFSDHPSSAWYGAWYISEVMDILTKNPEVWKKTIFILTYDENDGYFDHVPPFVAPHPHQPGTGAVSKGIDTGVEYVSSPDQQSMKEYARESPIGLGYRVPMVIASPWSRGGWVCSEVFDHSSSLQFLEHFLAQKTGKEIRETNMSQWRRTISGNLRSVFRPYNGEKTEPLPFPDKDSFIESIHKAKFKKLPSDYKKLMPEEIAAANRDPQETSFMPRQEKGIRSSCALPYELYADVKLSSDRSAVEAVLKAGNGIFGTQSAGSPFNIYAPGTYRQESVRTWAYAVAAGDSLTDRWPVADFENGEYHLQVYGPNGFFREFKGNRQDPELDVDCSYERSVSGKKAPTGNILLALQNTGGQALSVEITDHSYKTGARTLSLRPASSGKAIASMVLDLAKSHGWYDFSVRIKGHSTFEKRYAGRVESGKPGKTDPAMGRVI